MTDLVQLTYWDETTQTEKDCYPVVAGQSSRNVGEIISSTLPLTDAGLHLLDGSLLQYGIYKEFIDYIADLYAENPSANYFCTESDWQSSVSTYGVCGKFVYDSTNNTVRLPKITGIIEGTTDVNALGDLVGAGLPNITGNLYNISETWVSFGNADGSFYKSTGYNAGNTPIHIDNSNSGAIHFNASRSSSIYGNSSTVQPQTIKAFYYIVIATSTKTDVQVDIDKIATDLNGKADTDLSNVTDTAKVMMSGMAMPSDRHIELTLGASGSTYTAPADGWLFLLKVASASGQYIQMHNTTSHFIVFSNSSGPYGQAITIPCKKNDNIDVSYTTARNTLAFRFIYAQGSESEAQ